MLRLENLTKRFGKITALYNINLEIPEGIFCVVLGPSGCGKSTLLNLIAGLDEPSEGRIYLDDKEITDLPPHKRNFAMVFQSYALYPHLTVFENMAFGLRVRGMKEEEIEARVKRVSKILNIEEKLYNLPGELSGGQKQRVATGRAIVRDPKLFLFDEPLSNLDARLRMELRTELIKLHKQLKKTIIYVTHDQVEAMALGEMVVLLKDGHIQQISSPRELYYDPRNLFVAQFIGIPPMNIIELKVSRDKGRIVLVKDEFRLQLPPDVSRRLEKFLGESIYFGIRASNIGLREKTQIRGKVLFIEIIGEENFAHINLTETIEINVKIDNPDLRPQDYVFLSFDFSRSYFFDNRGKRIYSVQV